MTRTHTACYSDLSGEAEAESHSLQLDGLRLDIDLTAAEFDELQASLADYFSVGRTSTMRERRRRVNVGRSYEELQEARAWLRAQGHRIAPSGRISKALLEEYDRRDEA